MNPPDGLPRAQRGFDLHDLVDAPRQKTAVAPAPAAVSVPVDGFAAVLAAILLVLCGMSVALPLAFQALGGINREVFRLFDVRHEANIPTLFASVQLFVASGLTLLIAVLERRNDRRQVPYWFGLAVAFAYLGVDETVQLHEMLAKLPVPSGFMPEWTWAPYYGSAALLGGCACIPFLGRLQRATATTFLLAGATFVAGSVGLEVLGTYQTKIQMLSRGHPHFGLRVHAEELLEMLGVWLFVWGALRHLRRWPRVSFRFAGAGRDP